MIMSPRSTDRRIERTRQLLKAACWEVLLEKGFDAMTVHDITERANVNRGTFYAHFADKYDLFDAVMRERFILFLASKLPPVSRWDNGTLRLLMQPVAEFLAKCKSESLGPLAKQGMHEELTKLIATWLRQDGRATAPWPVPIETMAQVISWVIVGAAAQRNQAKTAPLADTMPDDVLRVLMEGVAQLVPAAPGPQHE